MSNDTSKSKLTGSYVIKRYSSFNYTLFLLVLRSTRYKIYRDSDSKIYIVIALSDPIFDKASFDDYIAAEWKNDIINVKDYKTWKAAEKAIHDIIKLKTDTILETEKKYIPGKKIK